MYLVFIIHFIIAIHTATFISFGKKKILVSRFWSISLGAKFRASNAVSRWQNPYTPPYVCVVQLVECDFAKVEVTGSYPVMHSIMRKKVIKILYKSREV